MSGSRAQEARWIKILTILRQQRPTTASTLSEALEVSRRTIQRDLDALRDDHGAPIAYDRERHTLYLAEPDWQMPILRLTESELFHLVIAAGMAGQFRGTPIARGLLHLFRKLESALQAPVDLDPALLTTQLSFHNGHERPIKPAVWKALAQAIRRKKVLKIWYRTPRHTNFSRLELAPLHLSCRQGDWYLLARYPSDHTVRTYALSRIQQVKQTARTFAPLPQDGNPDPQTLFSRFAAPGKEKATLVRVRFTVEASAWVRERSWHPKEMFREHRDGSLTLTLPIDGDKEALAWVLSWGSQARVLSPKWLREQVLIEARAMEKGASVP